MLQRFYHQQNQLREKEAAERYQQQRQQPPLTSTNPFHSNYVAPPPSTHSTSSQSSTQSNCSQIAVSPSTGMRLGLGQGSGSGSGSGSIAGIGAAPEAAAGHFGAGGTGEHLQYQPLPIGGSATDSATASATTSPSSLLPRSPEQQPTEYGGGQLPGSMVTSKLSKLYARRQLLGQSSTTSSGASNSSLDGCSREQHDAGELNYRTSARSPPLLTLWFWFAWKLCFSFSFSHFNIWVLFSFRSRSRFSARF